MEKQTTKEKASAQRYGRTQNIRVVLSSYLAELRESQYKSSEVAVT